MNRSLFVILMCLMLLVGCAGIGSGLPSEAKAALDAYIGNTDYQVREAQQGRANRLPSVFPATMAQIEELWCVVTNLSGHVSKVYLWKIGLRWQVSFMIGGNEVNGMGGFRENECTIG